MTLNVCMQYGVLEYFEVSSIDDPRLTLTYFTVRLNLVPSVFVREKLKQCIFQKLL